MRLDWRKRFLNIHYFDTDSDFDRMMGDKEDAHGFGDVWRMDDSNQNGGHTCTKRQLKTQTTLS